MKKFGLFLLVASIGLFAACSSDKKHDEVDPTDYAQEIDGKYWGNLEVTLPGGDPISSKDNVTLTRINDNLVKLVLKDFHLETIDVGDITLNDVEVAKDGNSIVFKEKSEKITLAKLPGVTATVTVTGKVVGAKIELNLNITDVAVFPGKTIKVVFGGDKLDNPSQDVSFFDMEEWVVEYKEGDDPEKWLYVPAGGWGSSNFGAKMLDYFTGGLLCVTKSEDSHKGKYAASIMTLDSKGENIFGDFYSPKITSGSLFTGKFKLADLTNTLLSTKFGIPFSKKPLKFSGYYKYTSGTEYHECPDPSKYYETNIVDKKDECAIAAYLYEYDAVKAAEDEKLGDENPYSTYLTGANIKTSDAVIAVAELKDGSEKKDYTLFNEEFKYKAGKEYDKTKTYRLAIVTSSSKDGDKFSGAPGSVLFLDDIQIVSE